MKNLTKQNKTMLYIIGGFFLMMMFMVMM